MIFLHFTPCINLSPHTGTIVISHVLRTSEQPLIITCATTGLPATEVLWSKGGTTLVDGVTYQISQSITDRRTSGYINTLTIGGATEDATGIYSCSVSMEIHRPGTTTDVGIGKCSSRGGYVFSSLATGGHAYEAVIKEHKPIANLLVQTLMQGPHSNYLTLL